MSLIDWVVLVGTIAFIVVYGIYKNRHVDTSAGYLKGDDLRWPTIGLSIMATQASAITFLSVPGQAYEDGMRFVQFYFGLPIAMVIISAVIVPIYYKLDVFTAYEYLERRFDTKTRVLGAFLFLIQRGLAAGISIYAPAIILSSLMGWSLDLTCLVLGLTVIVYTVSGGSKAVSQTQRQQMVVIFAGIIIAAVVIAWRLPDGIGVGTAAGLAGALGRMNVIDFELDPDTRYTFWSGITGGLFLALSYFGTDQSQVQRYLGGRSITESRLGLLFNGILKIPMQFLILFIGVLVFVFYLFNAPPVFFNQPAAEKVRATVYADEYAAIEDRWQVAFGERRDAAAALAGAIDRGEDTAAAEDTLRAAHARMDGIRAEAKTVIKAAVPGAEVKDSDYIFVSFVLQYLPAGLIGLLLAVILSAAMSSTASELNALGSTTVIDLYRRLWRPDADDRHTLLASKVATAFWGVVALAFASFAALIDNLIQAVNILGSLFYGTILGIFLVAFFVRWVRGTAVFLAALVAEAGVIALYFTTDIGYLWFNVIGCAIVMAVAITLQAIWPAARPPTKGTVLPDGAQEA
ncbi:MAG: sodium:solute symporter [Myxococcales bacterium]|nr:sodium:solute symporter [Myxococcales bacterium]